MKKKQDEVVEPEIIEMKPLPPIKPTEKLPLTYHLTLVKTPEKGERFQSVILTEMQGDIVKRRKVAFSTESLTEALDELNRLATRAFWFHEGKELMNGEET